MPLPATIPFQNPYGQLVNFQTENVLPPSAVYLGPNDSIFVQALIPTILNAVITITYRILKPDGTIAITTDTLVGKPVITFNNVLVIPPQEGFLLSFTAAGNNVSRGQVFMRVFIQTGGTLGGNLSHLLCQGYISAVDFVAFPQSPLEGSLNGRGWLRVVNIADVTGGTPSWTVPANTHWLFRCVNGQFQASAAGAARSLSLTCFDGLGNEAFQIGAAGTVAPSGTSFLSWAPGLTLANAGLFQTMGAPRDFVMTPGFVLALNDVTLDVADKWTILNLTIEEFVGQ